MAGVQLKTTFPAEHVQRLEAEAARIGGIDRHDLIRRAVELWLQTPQLAERIDDLEARVAGLEHPRKEQR